ncbi:MAG: BREX system ATP-binding domain-containing protein, partial [Candidatus Hodarchaeales archaeon]
MTITRNIALKIINKLGETGTPPETGASYFSVGLDTYIGVLENEYLNNNLKIGISSFKLLVGDYGAGKTHFLYVLREYAWKYNFVVSLVKLSPASCPLDKLELVYKNICSEIAPPPKDDDVISYTEMGFEYLLEDWFDQVREQFMSSENIEDPYDNKLITHLESYIGSFKFSIESNSFKNAIKKYFEACIHNDEYQKSNIISWLVGEDVDRKIMKELLIFERLNKSTAFLLIRSLCQFIRDINYSGLLIFFDEGERMSSISSSKIKKVALDNLRQIVDEVGNSRLPGVLFVYAITSKIERDEITEYVALRDRLRAARNMSYINPLSVRIDIETLDVSSEQLLESIAVKLMNIYEIA